VNVEDLAEADARDQSRGGGNRDPPADVRVAVDDGAGGLRKGKHARGMLHRFQPARDLRLLRGHALDRECRIRVTAQLFADAEHPAIELFEPGATGGALVEVRMATPRGPQARELAIAKMAAAEAFKK
jgi:hypothetical protein